jgi:hypothetical protein
MDFLALVLQASFLPVSLSPPSEPLGGPGCIVRSGEGDPCKSGDLVSIDFCIIGVDGKELANSEKRGISQTFVVLKSEGDDLLNAATLGARLGELRQVVLMKEDWYGGVGQYHLVRDPGPVIVRIRVNQITHR